MPQYLASRPMTMLGEEYDKNEPVPLDELSPRRAQKLIDHRLVEPDQIDMGSGDTPHVEVVHKGGKYYDVKVNGVAVNEKGLEEDDAELMAAKIQAGQ